MRAAIARRAYLGLPALLCAALMLPLDSQALTLKPGPPLATTSNVSHVRGTSATLNGTVQPHGLTTTYFFQYGPTVAYGTQTAPGSLAAGYTRIKVGQTVVGLRIGEHFRLAAKNAAGVSFGRDRTFGAKSGVLRFSLPKEKGLPPTPYGGTYVIRGSLTGLGSGFHKVALESSPYPYLEPFAAVGTPATTSASGSFTLRLAHLTSSTQLRVATIDPRPLYSTVVSVRVSVRVTLKVRHSARRGFVRLYGTVTPAEVGVHVAFQLEKAIRPGRSERETAFQTQFSTKTKRATHSESRFSFITSVKRGGRYRAYVLLRKGALTSGASSSVQLSAAPAKTKARKH